MATRRLTVNLFDFTDQAVSVPVTVQLDSSTYAPADGGQPARWVLPHSVTRHTNQSGVAVFDLIPSADLSGTPQYRASWTGGSHAGLSFLMPDTDATLFQLVNQPSLPPPAPTLPVNVEAGQALIYGTGWQARTPLHAGTAPPSAAAQVAVWWDTSQSPPDPRYTTDAGQTWQELRDPADMAAALNSLTGSDRVSGEHIQGQVTPPISTTLPATTGYRPGSFYIVQGAGQTSSADLYFLTSDANTSVSNRNRIQFTIANNVLSASSDNYRNFLGSIHYDATHRRINIRLDTGLDIPIPDQLWVTGIEDTGATAFQVDPFVPFSFSGGRRYKELRGTISTGKAQAGINGAQTWLFFTDLGVSEEYDFKPPVIITPGVWTQAGGGGGPLEVISPRAYDDAPAATNGVSATISLPSNWQEFQRLEVTIQVGVGSNILPTWSLVPLLKSLSNGTDLTVSSIAHFGVGAYNFMANLSGSVSTRTCSIYIDTGSSDDIRVLGCWLS